MDLMYTAENYFARQCIIHEPYKRHDKETRTGFVGLLSRGDWRKNYNFHVVHIPRELAIMIGCNIIINKRECAN